MTTSVPKKANRFPLFIHKGKGYWCKTVLGKHKYFGKVADDPNGQKALKRWLAEKEWLLAGLEPPANDDSGVITVKSVCNAFMESKEAALNAGDLAQRTYDELLGTCKVFMGIVPPSTPAKVIGPVHFASVLAAINRKYTSPNSRGKFIGQVKTVFKHAYETGLLERPANFGLSFSKPKQKAYRKHENAKGDQTFDADQIKQILGHADVNAKAMILLGINAGFLNTELAELPRSVIKGDYLEWPRAKTCTFRRVKLWTETKASINAAIEAGPVDGELVFYRSKNRDFSDAQRNGRHVGRLFESALDAAKIEGHSFRDLRYTFQTVAEEAPNLDPPAIRLIMGHTDSSNDMASRYRQRISDERLSAVTDHVRQWVFDLCPDETMVHQLDAAEYFRVKVHGFSLIPKRQHQDNHKLRSTHR